MSICICWTQYITFFRVSVTIELYKLCSMNFSLLCHPTPIHLSLSHLSTSPRVYTLSSTLVRNAPLKESSAFATSKSLTFLTGFTGGSSQEWFLFLRHCPLTFLQRVWFAGIFSSVIFTHVLSQRHCLFTWIFTLGLKFVSFLQEANSLVVGACVRHNRQIQSIFSLLISIRDVERIQYFLSQPTCD